MTNQERAAMQQALEALELIVVCHKNPESISYGQQQQQIHKQAETTITALREALDHSGEANEMVAEQAEQKPVGIVWDASAPVVMDSSAPKNENQEVAELRQQVAALKAVIDAWNNVEQVPVAEVVLRSCKVGFGRTEERKDIVFLSDVEVGTKLYAATVRTKDLTDAELNNLWIGSTKGGWLGLFRAVIAADREKNK